MAKTILSVVICVLVPVTATALEYAGTCRGLSATVVEIEGLDTLRARALAQYTLPDAISYCHYSLGRAENKRNPSSTAALGCAEKFLRESRASGPIKAEANCKIGTLSTYGGKWSNAYKFPVAPMCGDDNNQAISLFKMLCPSYEGEIENLN